MRIVKPSKSGVEPVKVIGPSMPLRLGRLARTSRTREGRLYLGCRFGSHFKATEALETGIEDRGNMHWCSCWEFNPVQAIFTGTGFVDVHSQGFMGSPLIRAAQLPPFFPPGTFKNSVVILTLFCESLISWTPPSRGSYWVQV